MKSKRDRKIHKDVTIKLVSLVRERVYMKYYASFIDVLKLSAQDIMTIRNYNRNVVTVADIIEGTMIRQFARNKINNVRRRQKRH